MQTHHFDDSGQLTRPSEKQLKEADASASIVAYTTGTMADGRPYYAYLLVKPSKYREFYERSAAREAITLNHYGKIVVSGFELAAPPAVADFMAKKYGYDEQYQIALQDEIKRQRGAFSTQREEKRLLDIVAMMKAKKA